MVIARSVWKASPTSLPASPMILPATEVFIHHTVTAVTADPYADMRAVEAVGLERFGQFPYSYCVHPRDGEILEGCGLRRGAHTADRNSRAFGIAWIGNYNDRAPKAQQLDATRRLIADLTRQGFLEPGAVILGHRDAVDRDTGRRMATDCPGANLYKMLDVIRHPWEATMPDDPALPNLPDIKSFHPVVNTTTGECTGYYILSTSGELHAFGPGAKFWGRSEVVR